MIKNKRFGFIEVVFILILIGIFLGISSYTFYYAKGYSYLLNDPKACINCHVMNDNYQSWIQSSHKNVATCNDCHAPVNFFGKWGSKAANGFLHSLAFTTGNYPDPIRIKNFNKTIVKNQCIHCHQNIFYQPNHHLKELNCVNCHHSVGHGR